MRLGLGSTWAYFSVLSGGRLHREPDRSGAPRPPASHPPPPAVVPERQGGAAPVPSGTVSAQTAGAAGGVPAS
jgi:hypothetical protein